MFHFGRKSKEGAVEITVSNQTVVRVLLLTIASYILLSAINTARHAFILIFTAFFLALALNVPVHWLAQRLPGKRRGSRKLATSISFFIIIALLAGFLASIVPPLVRQTSNFIDVAPQLVEDARSENSGLGQFIRKYKLEGQTQKLSGELGDRLKKITGSAVSGFTRITSSIFSTLTILVLTFMMLIEGPAWIGFARRLIPDNKERHAEIIAHDMYKVITGFVNGQVTLAALAAVLILVPLLAFHVSYPIALMVIVFICGLIPLVGHTIGAVIVSAIALFHSPVSALGMLIYYITYQQIENYVLQPKIQANSTNMSPLLVFASVIIGVNFGGLFGGLVAIPVAGCLRIIILDYLTSRKILSKKESHDAKTL
ncbi:MAG TPA: AI-2E family transporter, partial [Candidatus Limnocylindrales bacterium]|nr:AI-2E family transporter [Candidatus Limnocylindrales bacterium]